MPVLTVNEDSGLFIYIVSQHFLSDQEARNIFNNSSPPPTAFQPIRIDFNAFLWPIKLSNPFAQSAQFSVLYVKFILFWA